MDDYQDLAAWPWIRVPRGKSIFPHFDVGVPMPEDTAIPPKVILVPADPAEDRCPIGRGDEQND